MRRFFICLTSLAVVMTLMPVATAQTELTRSEFCETNPDHLRCQESPKSPEERRREFCEANPDHRRCQQPPVDRCTDLADNPERCIRPDNWRQLFWRLIHAGEWKLLLRLLNALGLL